MSTSSEVKHGGLAKSDKPNQPKDTKSVTLDVPSGLRLGQALIVALQRSGDLLQSENISTHNGKQISHNVFYMVKGQDLFYMTNSEIQAKLNDLVATDKDTSNE